MIDETMGTLRRAEPVENKVEFIRLAQRLEAKYAHLGGGDIWHLMTAIELQTQHSPTTLFSFDAKLISAARSEGLHAVCGTGLDPDRVAEELRTSGKLK
jgi:hypothetical protein